MSKASVAQEPSMDEILASIRRIIETGDERSGSVDQARSPGPIGQRRMPAFLGETLTPAPVASVSEKAEAVIESVAADSEASDQAWPNVYRVEPPRQPDAVSPFQVGEAERVISGEDAALEAELETELAATWQRIETASENVPETAGTSYEASVASGDAVGEHLFAPEPADDSHDVPHGQSDDAHRIDHRDHHQEDSMPESFSERGSLRPANTDAASADTPLGSSERYGDTPAPLASRNTGALVGASFNELAEAIRQGELKSLDEMAREMLQPMLRDWLDDNLPQMVERLVREEIERMARGGKR